MSFPLVPDDAPNRALLDEVCPRDWINPSPRGRYDLVVLGGGPSGSAAARIAAAAGAKVALVEQRFLGGDCLNFGGIPVQTLIRSARAAAEVRSAASLGVQVPGGFHIDFGKVMKRVRMVRSELSSQYSAHHLEGLGIDVFLGTGSFRDHETVIVGDSRLRFQKAIIATGATHSLPTVQGLAETDVLSMEAFFSLEQLPRRLAILGGGQVGCEIAQAMARLGSQVLLLESAPQILSRTDADAAFIVQEALIRDGVSVFASSRLRRVQSTSEGKVVLFSRGEEVGSELVDAILNVSGQIPRVRGIGLEAVGVTYNDGNGVKVDDFLRTSDPRIYAMGEVASNHPYAHAAEPMARVVIENALFRGRSRASRLLVPWCAGTDPEIAQIGLNERLAADRAVEIDVYRSPFSATDRACMDGATEGFVKILTAHKTDRMIGATVVGHEAGNLVGELSLAMATGCGLRRLSDVIHPYPTHSAAIRQVSQQYMRNPRRFTSRKWTDRWLRSVG
jgi:pyruvate/2-oxoglutarate dehydrogenase complex dihydrolipoamide dehydrogenase (E3) component